ncbi:hypothetical protein [Amycolatopsis magusensis]|uniref:Mannosyltransferase (PIG-V) n=1 Tax=Amycolatopsis magusensis TaxID=882444 RepID=A0ABS4PIZ7_9PSEU|nr:hypothetical protein [Amycolatopsis magusensis]MBP2179338.1 hypothetical protein [Amycolatopsis magusensis]
MSSTSVTDLTGAAGAGRDGNSGGAHHRQPDERRDGLRRAGFFLLPAILFLAVRQLGVLVLSVLSGVNNTTTHDSLTAWDGQWFLGIAQGGYAGVPPGLVDAFGRRSFETPLAFFPGYPTAVRWLTELTGLALPTAAFLLSGFFGVVTAYALMKLGRMIRGGSDRVGYILVVLFAASPMGVVLSMAYSESMFCAAAAWALVFVLDRQWLAAGACTAVAGLVRPTAAAVLLAVGVAVLLHVVRKREVWHPLAGLLVAPVGLVGYLTWVGVQLRPHAGWFDQLQAWTDLQRRGWDSRFDWGQATVTFAGKALGRSGNVLEIATIAILVAALVLVVIAIKQRLELPLVLYGVGVLLMDLGSNGLMNSKARLLVPAFTLLIPLALALAKRRTSTVVLTLCAAAVASAWFGAYSLTIWQYAI